MDVLEACVDIREASASPSSRDVPPLYIHLTYVYEGKAPFRSFRLCSLPYVSMDAWESRPLCRDSSHVWCISLSRYLSITECLGFHTELSSSSYEFHQREVDTAVCVF